MYLQISADTTGVVAQGRRISALYRPLSLMYGRLSSRAINMPRTSSNPTHAADHTRLFLSPVQNRLSDTMSLKLSRPEKYFPPPKTASEKKLLYIPLTNGYTLISATTISTGSIYGSAFAVSLFLICHHSQQLPSESVLCISSIAGITGHWRPHSSYMET